MTYFLCSIQYSEEEELGTSIFYRLAQHGGRDIIVEFYGNPLIQSDIIFNAEETCFVSSALNLPGCPYAVSHTHEVHCANSAMPNLTELLCMHGSNLIPAWLMTAAGIETRKPAAQRCQQPGVKLKGRRITGEVSIFPL